MSAEKPVVEADSTEEVLQEIEEGQTGEMVGVTDNAIIFRNEIIVTDPEIKERVADALVDSVSGPQF
ncbi:MAG: hypothetical protein ABEI52_09770 [Halobacteriaceae archaeon]